MTEINMKIDLIVTSSFKVPVPDISTLQLKHIVYIYYLLYFKKDQAKIQALINSSNGFNIMTSAYAKKTNIGAQIIDDPSLTTYKMVIAGFQVSNKFDKTSFFQEIFLLTNTRIDIILVMLFLTLSNPNILFVDQKLICKFYTIAKALPTTRRVRIIDIKKFAERALDKNVEVLK